MAVQADEGLLAVNGIELRHLRALVAMAEEVHYGRAATRLHLAQSTLSRTLADLEALVGLRLIDRSQRTAGLTEPGRALLGAAERALGIVHEGLEAARAASGPGVTLGLMGACGYPWLPKLARRFAGLAVRPIHAEEGFAPLERDVDVGVYPLPILTPPNLRHETLRVADCWVALPSGHPLARAQTVRLAQLAHEPLLLPAADTFWPSNLQLISRAQGLQVRLGVRPRSMHEAMVLVAEGAGWAVAASRADFHAWQGVELRRVVGLDRVRIAAVWSASRHSPATEELVAAIAELAGDDRTAEAA